jgi:hypothetical protein
VGELPAESKSFSHVEKTVGITTKSKRSGADAEEHRVDGDFSDLIRRRPLADERDGTIALGGDGGFCTILISGCRILRNGSRMR